MTNFSRYVSRPAESKGQKLTGEAMELHEIRYFLALSQTRNFTRAAELCHVSQPALTRAIRKMEDELGGLLVSRERNNTHLTEMGRMIEPHLAEAMARAETAKQTAIRFQRLDAAQLRLGVMRGIAPMRFAGMLAGFRAEYPGVEIILHEAGSAQLCTALEKGELDAALQARPEGFAPPLQPQPLYHERFVVACAADHPIASRNSVRVRDLDGQSCLSRTHCEYRDLLTTLCAANGARLMHCLRGEGEEWILTMIAGSSALCLVPEHCALPPGVVSRPLIDPPIEREVCLVTMAGRRWSSPLAALVQALRRYHCPEPADTAAISAARQFAASGRKRQLPRPRPPVVPAPARARHAESRSR